MKLRTRSPNRISLLLVLVILSLSLIWMAFSTYAVPPLIKSAYRGESLPIFNRMISGQASHRVAEYLSDWDRFRWRVLLDFSLVSLLAVLVIRPEPQRFLSGLMAAGRSRYMASPYFRYLCTALAILAFYFLYLSRGAISDIVVRHFLEVWALVLVCAASLGFLCPCDWRTQRLDSSPESDARPARYSWKLKNRDIVCLVLFAVFLILWICLQLWKEDFAFHDDYQLTDFSLRGKSFPAPVWPSIGRLFPLHLQELNLLKHLAHSPDVFHTFVVLQLLAWALLTAASLSEFTVPFRVLALFLIMSTLGFVISFSDLIYPERNVLFWLAVFILCRRRYFPSASPVFLAGTLISVQFALYYKEPVWLLFAGFAGTKLACEWNVRSRERPVRNFIKDNLADIGTMVLALLFPALFVLVMFGQPRLAYVEDVRSTLPSTILKYVKVDLLCFIFLTVVAVRFLRALLARSKLDSFWDPLATGGALYALAIVGLRIPRGYLMAPVDAIAILFLLQRAHTWFPERKALRTLIVAALCFVTVVQNMAYASVYFTTRKNVIAGNVELAEFLKGYIQGRSNGSVGLFFPYSDGYRLMELSSFLEYKGLPMANEAPDGQGNGASLVMKSPLSFPENRCVGFKPESCVHAQVPHSGDLVVELPEDHMPHSQVARNDLEQVLFSYEPFLVSQRSFPFFDHLISFLDRKHLPKRWLQVHVYKSGAPVQTGQK